MSLPRTVGHDRDNAFVAQSCAPPVTAVDIGMTGEFALATVQNHAVRAGSGAGLV